MPEKKKKKTTKRTKSSPSKTVTKTTAKAEVVVRKTKYDPEMCEKIVDIAKGGGGVSAMCLAIGIKSRDTFYRWLKEHEDFAQAYEKTKNVSQAVLEDILVKMALGELPKGNFNAVSLLLHNRHRDQYFKEAQTKTEINIGQLNNIESLDISQLDSKIQTLQKKLGVYHEPELIEHDPDNEENE